MDRLGNYTNISWFMDLNKNQIIKMIREIIDIWNYRASLTKETREAICPPNGNPFQHLNLYLIQNKNIDDIRLILLNILEQFVNNGIDKDSKILGTYYVLASFTLVNYNASLALPWLYQTVI
jgi:hypothetical protein